MPMTSALLRYLLPVTLEKRSVQVSELESLDLAVPAEMIAIDVADRQVTFVGDIVQFDVTVEPSDPSFNERFPTPADQTGALSALFQARIEILRRCPVTALPPVIT